MSSEGIFRLSKVMRIGDKIVIIRVEEEDMKPISLPRPCLCDHASPSTFTLGRTLFSSPSGPKFSTKLEPGVYLPAQVIQTD